MEFSFVPLIEAIKGLTTQGAAVLIACLAAACYLARLRLIYSREERAWWSSNHPEIVQARAATTATLPKPTKAPPGPLGPVAMLAVFLGCAFTASPGPAPSILQAHKVKRTDPSDSWLPSAQAGELARAGTGDPGKPTPPGPVRKDCDPRSCKPPSYCSKGECIGTARKPPPAKMAGAPSRPSSFAVRSAWQDSEPEAFPERLTDSQWLAGL